MRPVLISHIKTQTRERHIFIRHYTGCSSCIRTTSVIIVKAKTNPDANQSQSTLNVDVNVLTRLMTFFPLLTYIKVVPIKLQTQNGQLQQ